MVLQKCDHWFGERGKNTWSDGVRKGGKGLRQIMNENKRNDGKGEREKRSRDRNRRQK